MSAPRLPADVAAYLRSWAKTPTDAESPACALGSPAVDRAIAEARRLCRVYRLTLSPTGRATRRKERPE